MKTSTQQIESTSTPGIFQPVFSGSVYGQPYMPYSLPKGPATTPAISRSYASSASSTTAVKPQSTTTTAAPPAVASPNIVASPYEASFSLFGAELHHDSWNIFTAQSHGGPPQTPDISAVSMDFASDLNADGLADSLLNTAAAAEAAAAAAGGVSISGSAASFSLPLDSDLPCELVSSASLKSSSTRSSAGHLPASSSSSSSTRPPSTAFAPQSFSSSASRATLCEAPSLSSCDQVVNRPELTEEMIEELNDINEFKNDEKYGKHLLEYQDEISFPIGEGGRELLRACLNVRGCKGRQLQGASVPVLLQLAHQWNLWDVALRIKIERQTGQLSPAHEAFVRFKATQSQMRKYMRKEYMVTERDQCGKISRIHYDETRKIKLGKDGREALRAKLRRLHDKHANRMDELLAQHGFKYSELRNATVQQLSRMAFVCNLWDQVVGACRSQEEKKDGRGNAIGGGRPSLRGNIMLPLSLINEPITTDENGEMSNHDARRTMDAVSEMLQKNYPAKGAGCGGQFGPELLNSTNFSNALEGYATSIPAASPPPPQPSIATLVKQEPTDDDLVATRTSQLLHSNQTPREDGPPPVDFMALGYSISSQPTAEDVTAISQPFIPSCYQEFDSSTGFF